MTGHAPDNPNQPRPGWYPDPGGQQLLRWWDGVRWTAQAQPMSGTPWQGQVSWPRQPAMAIQVNQQASFPSGAVTRRPLGVLETCFHAFMTFCTFGLWAPVWWGRVRMRRSYTTFR